MDISSKMIFELDSKKDKTATTPWKDQFKEGIEIGRINICEKINMIILIILSLSLFPICKNINSDKSFSEICNSPEIFEFLLIGIITGIGVCICVFVTALMYSSINRKKTIYKTVSENKVDGKRSLKL